MNVNLEWSNRSQADIPEAWIDKLNELLRIAAAKEAIEAGEVALSFVDDDEIQSLNRQYRSIDRPTDVLSFPMEDDEFLNDPAETLPLLGDIIISIPAARRQSEEYKHSLLREIGFLFVHGLLHLLGYDHQDEETEAEMIAKQEEILIKAGLPR